MGSVETCSVEERGIGKQAEMTVGLKEASVGNCRRFFMSTEFANRFSAGNRVLFAMSATRELETLQLTKESESEIILRNQQSARTRFGRSRCVSHEEAKKLE